MHGNNIPVGTVIELDPATMKASEQRTLIQMQRRMIRTLNRDKKFWFWAAIATNMSWLGIWLTR